MPEENPNSTNLEAERPRPPTANPSRSSHRSRRRPVIPVGLVVVQNVDPCCMPLTNGVILIAFVETVVYLISMLYYIYFAGMVGNSKDEEVRAMWGHEQFYKERRDIGISESDTTAHIKKTAIAEVVICSIYVVLSSILLLAAMKKIRAIGYLWVSGVLILTTARVYLLVMTPLPAFQFGLIWLLFEMYFVFVVVTFDYELKRNPRMVDQVDLYQVPVNPSFFEMQAPFVAGYPFPFEIVPVREIVIDTDNTNDPYRTTNTTKESGSGVDHTTQP